MIVTIKPKNGKPIKKSFSDPQKAIEWINSTTAELAAQQTRAADSCNCRHENNKDGTKRMYVNPWCPLHSNCR